VSLHSVYHSCIEAYTYIVCKQFFKWFLNSKYFLLIFYIINFPIFKGFYSNIPHIIKSNCSIHPLFSQKTYRLQILLRNLYSFASPPYTATEIVSCPDWNDSKDNLREIKSFINQLWQNPWNSSISPTYDYSEVSWSD
jgi:hypothetical protein